MRQILCSRAPERPAYLGIDKSRKSYESVVVASYVLYTGLSVLAREDRGVVAKLPNIIRLGCGQVCLLLSKLSGG